MQDLSFIYALSVLSDGMGWSDYGGGGGVTISGDGVMRIVGRWNQTDVEHNGEECGI